MTKTIEESAQSYATILHENADKSDEKFYYTEAQHGGEYTAALSILGEKSENIEETKQRLMAFANDFEFRNGDMEKVKFIELAETQLQEEQKAFKFFTGKDRSVENAQAAVKQLDSLFRRTFTALEASLAVDKMADINQDYRDLCIALDVERGLAFEVVHSKE